MSKILWCKMCVCVYGLEATSLCLASKLMKKNIYTYTDTYIQFETKRKRKQRRERKTVDLYFGILGFSSADSYTRFERPVSLLNSLSMYYKCIRTRCMSQFGMNTLIYIYISMEVEKLRSRKQ